MFYYKIIQQNTVVDIVEDPLFLRYNKKLQILLPCSKESAQYLQASDSTTLYHDSSWMLLIKKNNLYCEKVQIIQIEKDEYNILLKAFESNEEILIEQPEPESIEEKVFVDPIEEATIDFIRNSKLTEMSHNCNKTITNGFDIMLSDGNSYHFSLTTQDQLNLITLATMVESGETQIPYHADGEPCKFYSTLDIKAIIDKATEFKTYHISYYNSLKIYINSMETMEEISEVTYGIEIPAEYQSEVLKTIMKG